MVFTQEVKIGGRKLTRYSKSREALKRRMTFFSNDTSAFVPEMWAEESVRLLWENMVYAGIVHRDFEDKVARFGETVHTRSIGTFSAKRKQNDLDDVSDQDATAQDIEVKLNQRAYVSFIIGDGERSKSREDLFETFLEPAVGGLARFLDQCVVANVYQFLDNVAGGLGQMSTSNGHDYLIDTRGVMNNNRVSEANRWMGLSSPSETTMQKMDLFKSAERRGDGGQALVNAILGRVAGFNTFLSLNTPSVRNATTTATTTTTASAVAGATVVAMTAVTNLNPGQYYTIDGDYTPLRVASVNTLNVTNTRALKGGVASGATVRPIALGTINQGSPIAAGDTTASVADGYPSGWMKEIAVDGTGVPKVGQLVAFRAAGSTVHAAEYMIVQYDSTNSTITLDRPLEDTLADNDIVCYGPSGDYNFALQRDALTLVNRPLALPPSGTGARASNAMFNNMSLRVTMTYDGKKQGTRVTIDGLFGTKVLNELLGAVMLG